MILRMQLAQHEDFPRPVMHSRCLIPYLKQLPALPADHPHRQHGVRMWRGAVLHLLGGKESAAHWTSIEEVATDYLLGRGDVGQHLDREVTFADLQGWIADGLVEGIYALVCKSPRQLGPSPRSACFTSGCIAKGAVASMALATAAASDAVQLLLIKSLLHILWLKAQRLWYGLSAPELGCGGALSSLCAFSQRIAAAFDQPCVCCTALCHARRYGCCS